MVVHAYMRIGLMTWMWKSQRRDITVLVPVHARGLAAADEI
jgi:hypothetical protein